MKKIAVLGNGQLGKTYKKLYPDVHVLTSNQVLNHPKNPNDGVPLWINFYNLEPFDVIINTIAVTNTKQCENDELSDYIGAINSSLPSYLSNYCHNRRKKFVQISTACVYKETYTICDEASEKAPESQYAKWKLQAELGLMRNDLILRGHLFFSDQDLPSNFLQRIRKFSSFIEESNSFTYVNDLVHASLILLENNCFGDFNVSCDAIASPFEIAKFLNLENISKISSEELRKSTNLIIPNIVLDNTKLSNYYTVSNLFDSINDSWKALNGI